MIDFVHTGSFVIDFVHTTPQYDNFTTNVLKSSPFISIEKLDMQTPNMAKRTASQVLQVLCDFILLDKLASRITYTEKIEIKISLVRLRHFMHITVPPVLGQAAFYYFG